MLFVGYLLQFLTGVKYKFIDEWLANDNSSPEPDNPRGLESFLVNELDLGHSVYISRSMCQRFIAWCPAIQNERGLFMSPGVYTTKEGMFMTWLWSANYDLTESTYHLERIPETWKEIFLRIMEMLHSAQILKFGELGFNN